MLSSASGILFRQMLTSGSRIGC